MINLPVIRYSDYPKIGWKIVHGGKMRRLLFTLGSLASTPALADTVENAYYLCALVDATGLASTKCEVSGWNQTVTASLDMNSEEARQLCGQLSGMMTQKDRRFDNGWTLQITSPYSGGNSTAYCNLPN